MLALRNNLFFTFVLLTYTTSVLADRGDPVEISADKVEIQEIEGRSIYEGNAKLTQGKDRITANRIIILHPEQEIESIRIEGSVKHPAYVLLHLKDGKKVEGHAVSIDYQSKTEILTLKHNVDITQGKNRIQAQSIVFNKKTQSLKANSGKKQRVITTFELPK